MGKIKNIVGMIGAVLGIIALTLVIPTILAIVYGENGAIKGFVCAILACALPALFIRFKIKRSDYVFKVRDGYMIVALSWVIASLVGAIPFMVSGSIPNFFDAFFESASGFTTTGSTILSDIEALPRSILFWRSFTHWIGGMGIIVFLSAVLPSWGINAQTLAYDESTGPTKGKITSKFANTARLLYLAYIVITLIEVVLLLLGGMSVYDAFVHTFGTVGTGGFSCYNDSIAHYQSMPNHVYYEIVIMIFMFISGINFNFFIISRISDLKKIFKDAEFKLYAFVTVAVGLVIFATNVAANVGTSVMKTLRDSFFQVVSILTTTGYATADYELWPQFSQMLILLLFFIGGCAGSTAGGIKCVRILGGYKLVKRNLSIRLHPNRVDEIKLNGKEITRDTSIRITNFIFGYIIILFVGTFLISLGGGDFMSNFSAAATCIGNIGPGFNAVGPTMNFSGLHGLVKLVCSVLMIIGRLEILSVFALFSKYYRNSNRSQ